MKVYIAFSIHGTNCFIVATREVTLLTPFITSNPEFSLTDSRRSWADKVLDGYKLNWTKLCKADGTPHTNPGWVLRRFKELERSGWTIINREKFVEHHYKVQTK
jgi:hypothetical protein